MQSDPRSPLSAWLILVSAQLAAASTASWVKALPTETPSLLRALWRQTLTSILFGTFSAAVIARARLSSKNDDGEERLERAQMLKNQQTSNESRLAVLAEDETSGARQILLVSLAIVGATLQNDCIVVALGFASSSAVMCLANTTPIWLIIYSVLSKDEANPCTGVLMGALLSILGTFICALPQSEEGDHQGQNHANEQLGAIIALLGGIGGATYMRCGRSLAHGLHPILLSFFINVGMCCITFMLCLGSMELEFSTSISRGIFGFVNPLANPPAILHSLFPDVLGNFGILLSLGYFEPLIVSLVMLTEPLNASIISYFVIHEHPPSAQTIIGVAVVLLGCGVVLSQENSELVRTRESICKMLEDGDAEEQQALDIYKSRRKTRRISVLVLSNAARIAPAIPDLGEFEFLPAGTRHSWHPPSRSKFSMYGSVDISGTYHL